ncbi:hypothetical protein C8R48DRAFT_751521 [Suillus tomentosus]|nr:hypothetical protein C8R48DRAFT_751521 [Suillus tomentosus]
MSQAMVEDASQPPESSLAVATSETARQRRKIAALEEKLQVLEPGHAVKQRETNYYMSKGRAIRRIVTLFDNIEDLICENDRRCELDGEDEDDRLQTGYITLNHALPWLHSRASDLEYDEYSLMLKKLRQGADSGRGDDTSKLKNLVADWINREFKPNPPVNADDKHCRGFVNDAVRAGIRDRTDGYIVTEMSWPTFLYEQYTADQDNLEKGLFKSTLLLQAFKAIFTSPSSAREVAGDGDAANLRFALSSVNSWRSIDGDFDYIPFWHNIVDFFERPPGRAAQQNVKRLLAWWTRKVFGTSRRAELSDGAKAKMSVNALARQRAQLDDALFDSE